MKDIIKKFSEKKSKRTIHARSAVSGTFRQQPQDRKVLIREAVARTVAEYGETLKRLGSE